MASDARFEGAVSGSWEKRKDCTESERYRTVYQRKIREVEREMKKEDGNSEEGMRDCLRDRARLDECKRASHRQEQDKDTHMMSRNVGKHTQDC